MDNNPIAIAMKKLGYSLWDVQDAGIFYRKMEADNGTFINLIMFKDWDAVNRFIYMSH